jgi:hypothetical protein
VVRADLGLLLAGLRPDGKRRPGKQPTAERLRRAAASKAGGPLPGRQRRAAAAASG